MILKSMLIAGLGGFIGTMFRYLVDKFFEVQHITGFPWGTFTVNVLGSFLIGVFYGLLTKAHILSPAMNLFLITGICGGFTTFSSLSHDALTLLSHKEWMNFGLYVFFSFSLGLVAVYLGQSIIKNAAASAS